MTVHIFRCADSLFIAAALAFGLCSVHSACAQSADVTLVKYRQLGAVGAQFVLSEPTKRLRFSSGADFRKLAWQLDGNGQISADGLSIDFKQPTRRFRVRMSSDKVADGQFDREYTPVLALNGGRAVAVYPDYLLPRAGGTVRIDGDGAAFGRRVLDGRPVWRANQFPAYLIVGTVNVSQTKYHAVTIDDAMPAWIASILNSRVEGITKAYAKNLPGRPLENPWIIATYESASGVGQPAFRGDVSGGVIRLNLIGPIWLQPDRDLTYKLETFIAHELFHLWNRGLWQAGSPHLSWLFEGGADAAAHDVLRRISGDGLRYERELTQALNSCTSTPGTTLAEKESHGARAPYGCGAAVFQIASALTRTSPHPQSVLDIWAAILDRQRGTKIYSAADLGAIVEKFGSNSEPIDTFLQMMSSKIAWGEALAHSSNAFGIRASTPADLDQPAITGRLLDELILSLVKHDCDGAMSVAYESQLYNIMALPSCRNIGESIVASSIEGVDMQLAPAAAFRRAREKCMAKLDVALSNIEGAQFLCRAIGCPPPPG